MPNVVTDGIKSVEDGVLLREESGISKNSSFTDSEDFKIVFSTSITVTVMQLFQLNITSDSPCEFELRKDSTVGGNSYHSNLPEKNPQMGQYTWVNLSPGDHNFNINFTAGDDFYNGKHAIIVLNKDF